MRPETIPAQTFDKMQFFYGDVQEPRIRCFVRFADQMDIPAFTRAVDLSVRAFPLLGCVFDEQSHTWRKRAFSATNIIKLQPIEQLTPQAVEAQLLIGLQQASEPQVKMTLLRTAEKDALCVVINHMVCDGAGFKEYLYLLANLYTRCENDPAYATVPEISPERGLGQLTRNLPISRKLRILFLKTKNGRTNPAMRLPFGSAFGNAMIIRRLLNAETFGALHRYAGTRGATLNDLILTAYMRALGKETGCEDVAVPCPVDLRRFAAPAQRIGLCNLTGNVWCTAHILPSEPFDVTMEGVASQMRAHKRSDACLKGPVLLHLLMRLLPFNVMRRQFGKISPVPVIGYTNLGAVTEEKFRFGRHGVEDMFISTAVKEAPYFQLSVCSWRGSLTLSSTLLGTEMDRAAVERFMDVILREMPITSLFR